MRLRKTSCSALVILPALSLILVGCGGSVNSTPGVISGNTPPVVTGVKWSPEAATQTRYRTYVYTASGMDPDLGDTIQAYRWQFGDGSPVMETTGPTINWAYGTGANTYSLKVAAVDARGAQGAWFDIPVAVDDSKSPLTLQYVQPTTEQTVNADVNGSVKVDYQIKVTDLTVGASVSLNGLRFETGDSLGQVIASTPMADGTFLFTVEYKGAAAAGTRTVTAACQATDSMGFASDRVVAKAVTIKTLSGVNHAPQVTVTDPASPTTGVFTTKPVDLKFSVTDIDADPVTYVVDWGDGSPVTRATVGGDTSKGQAVALTHTYLDSFTATSRDAVVTVNATDNRNGGTALTQTRTFRVTNNAFPVAQILTPIGSATLPSPTDLPSDPARGLVNPPGANDPDLVVIPNDSRLSFTGKATAPGSGDASLTYSWTFEGGVPSSSTELNPGEVTFAGVAGETRAYLVTFTVTDALGRRSDQASPVPSPRTYKKWVVVDGRNAQVFNLQFAYKQQIEDPATATIRQELSTVTTAANGLGADVQVIQDGRMSAYKVQDAAQSKAEVQIPVRANLPFYVAIAPFGTNAAYTQVLRIPNAPTGPYADASLGTTKPTASDALVTSSAFWFENPTATSAPWNPTLRIVTSRGFSPEVVPPDQRRLQGRYYGNLVWGQIPVNERWLDRLSVPDVLPYQNWLENPFPVALSNSPAGEFDGIKGLQVHAEWLIHLLSFSTGGAVPAAKNTDAGFVLDYAKYIGDTQASEAFAAHGMQATRVPAHTADNYDVSVGVGGSVYGWNNPSAVVAPTLTPATPPATGFTISGGLNPTPQAGAVSAFYNQAVFGSPGSTALAGGVNKWVRTYERNAPGLPVGPTPVTHFQEVEHPFDQGAGFGIRSTFSYAEYLWSSAWARPLVLNSARANYIDYYKNFDKFSQMNTAQPAAWPKLKDIRGGAWERSTSIDLTPAGGSDFSPSRVPVIMDVQDAATGNVPLGGIGRFFWTAAELRYSAAGGSLLSRTWLSGQDGKPVTAYSGGAGDATSVFGLIPPQDVVVDKQERDLAGNLTGKPLGGYRITWMNPTLDASKQVVAPDFWVVEFKNNKGATYHFVLPAAYPSGSQSMTASFVTDTRTYLPSGNGWGNPNLPKPGTPYDPANDQVVPGFCWFDVPAEFRGDRANPSGDQSITVFAVKSMAKVPYARPLRATDWVEALKTVTATIKIAAGDGDFSYAHKIPFNFAWDIVVGQSATHIVAP